MSSPSATIPQTVLGAQAVVQALLRNGIDTGFGIPSIHNIPIYEVLRQAKPFHHWAVRHEQAAGYAADGYYRQSGRVAVVFASTGPGNLFTLVPLLESLQTNTPVLVIGSNIATALEAGSGGANLDRGAEGDSGCNCARGCTSGDGGTRQNAYIIAG